MSNVTRRDAPVVPAVARAQRSTAAASEAPEATDSTRREVAGGIANLPPAGGGERIRVAPQSERDAARG